MTRRGFTKRALLAGGGALVCLSAKGHHPATLEVQGMEANVSIERQVATTELLRAEGDRVNFGLPQTQALAVGASP